MFLNFPSSSWGCIIIPCVSQTPANRWVDQNFTYLLTFKSQLQGLYSCRATASTCSIISCFFFYSRLRWGDYFKKSHVSVLYFVIVFKFLTFVAHSTCKCPWQILCLEWALARNKDSRHQSITRLHGETRHTLTPNHTGNLESLFNQSCTFFLCTVGGSQSISTQKGPKKDFKSGTSLSGVAESGCTLTQSGTSGPVQTRRANDQRPPFPLLL